MENRWIKGLPQEVGTYWINAIWQPPSVRRESRVVICSQWFGGGKPAFVYRSNNFVISPQHEMLDPCFCRCEPPEPPADIAPPFNLIEVYRPEIDLFLRDIRNEFQNAGLPGSDFAAHWFPLDGDEGSVLARGFIVNNKPVTLSSTDGLQIEISIIQPDYPGVHPTKGINFRFQVSGDMGCGPLVDIIPHNYTPDIWVDRADRRAIAVRFDFFRRAVLEKLDDAITRAKQALTDADPCSS